MILEKDEIKKLSKLFSEWSKDFEAAGDFEDYKTYKSISKKLSNNKYNIFLAYSSIPEKIMTIIHEKSLTIGLINDEIGLEYIEASRIILKLQKLQKSC